MRDNAPATGPDEVNRERAVPVILILGRPPAELLAGAGGDYVVACLLKAAKEADLQAAIARAAAHCKRSPAIGPEGRQQGRPFALWG